MFLFFNYWLILFNSCSYCTEFFNSIADFVIPITIPCKEAKEAIEIYPVIVEAKIRNS